MSKEPVTQIKKCRVCKKEKFIKAFNFGPTPLANEFLTKEKINREESFFPLDVYLCSNCSFLQLGHVVDPKILFDNYVYVSSTSPVFIQHFKDFAESVYKDFSLGKNSFVIDLGSNDGILLKPFKKLGVKILGIEPAKHIAKVAKKENIPTVTEYFSVKLAKQILKKNGKANVVTACNVFAHIDNLDEVIEGLKVLLDKDGIFIMEAPYLVDFFEKKYFDLVYHEHLSYWTVNSLIKLFNRFDMEVFDVVKMPVHGGTIRTFVKKKEGSHKRNKRVDEFLKLEQSKKLTETSTYLTFQREIEENKVKLLKLLSSIKKSKKTIAGYGAPAKGNTLLNYFGIGTELLDYIVDDSPWKQGLYTPGKRIPVVSSKCLYKNPPDFLLILAWNFAAPIMKTHEKYKRQGGKFIIPVPSPKII